MIQATQQLSLWNQRGSQVIRGNLLVVPIERSLVYVEPLYIAAEEGRLPELKRVIVAFGDRIRHGGDAGGRDDPGVRRQSPPATGAVTPHKALWQVLAPVLPQLGPPLLKTLQARPLYNRYSSPV